MTHPGEQILDTINPDLVSEARRRKQQKSKLRQLRERAWGSSRDVGALASIHIDAAQQLIDLQEKQRRLVACGMVLGGLGLEMMLMGYLSGFPVGFTGGVLYAWNHRELREDVQMRDDCDYMIAEAERHFQLYGGVNHEKIA